MILEQERMESNSSNHLEPFKAIEEGLDLTVCFVFRHVKSLASCTNQIIERHRAAPIHFLPERYPAPIETEIQKRLRIKEHPGSVIERRKNGHFRLFKTHWFKIDPCRLPCKATSFYWLFLKQDSQP